MFIKNNYQDPYFYASSHLVFGCLFTFVICLSSFSAWSGEKQITRILSADINWSSVKKGRQTFPIYGNNKIGHHITLVKAAAGLKTAPHRHTNDYIGVVISGIMRHYQPDLGNQITPLPPGSTWFIPGNLAHISECISKTECVFIVHQDGAVDFKIIGE